MSNVAPAATRRALQSCSRSASTSRALSRALARPATLSAPTTHGRRTYVSESSPRNATVNIETAIKADQKKFMQQTNLAPSQVSTPAAPGVSADAMMSPSGILKQATIMEEGTRPIYLDMQATTPMDPRVVDAVVSLFFKVSDNDQR